jgi:hypothetical protein
MARQPYSPAAISMPAGWGALAQQVQTIEIAGADRLLEPAYVVVFGEFSGKPSACLRE